MVLHTKETKHKTLQRFLTKIMHEVILKKDKAFGIVGAIKGIANVSNEKQDVKPEKNDRWSGSSKKMLKRESDWNCIAHGAEWL
jgi:hypothetical protein